MQYRLAKPAVANTLAEIRHSAWNSAYRGIYADELIDGFDFAEHAQRFLRQMEAPEVVIYTVQNGDCIIGYFSIYVPKTPEYKQFSVCLNSLYLRPEYHRRGIGRDVMEFVKAWCRERKYTAFYNSCNLHNQKARAFYEAMGGVLGEIDGGYDDPGADQCYYEYTVA